MEQKHIIMLSSSSNKNNNTNAAANGGIWCCCRRSAFSCSTLFVMLLLLLSLSYNFQSQQQVVQQFQSQLGLNINSNEYDQQQQQKQQEHHDQTMKVLTTVQNQLSTLQNNNTTLGSIQSQLELLQKQQESLLKQMGSLQDKMTTSGAAVKKEFRDFEKHERVVIASRTQGSKQGYEELIQSLCLFTIAYNKRLNYDIVVFTAEPLSDSQIQELESVVAPAKITVVPDSLTLTEQIQQMTKTQLDYLLKRCNVQNASEITWGTRCVEDNNEQNTIQYNWQTEFRSKHMWFEPALKPYKYMIWVDTDAFASQVFDHDPMAFFLRNELILLYDNFPQGTSREPVFHERIIRAFNKSLCAIDQTNDGVLKPTFGDISKLQLPLQKPENFNDGSTSSHTEFYNHDTMSGCPKEPNGHAMSRLQQVHSFFHLADLDFYRLVTSKYGHLLNGNVRFSRRFDDQTYITLPAAVLEPEKSWHMRKHGMKFNVMHNGKLDAIDSYQNKWFKGLWQDIKQRGEDNQQNPLDFAIEDIRKCDRYVRQPGRRRH